MRRIVLRGGTNDGLEMEFRELTPRVICPSKGSSEENTLAAGMTSPTDEEHYLHTSNLTSDGKFIYKLKERRIGGKVVMSDEIGDKR